MHRQLALQSIEVSVQLATTRKNSKSGRLACTCYISYIVPDAPLQQFLAVMFISWS